MKLYKSQLSSVIVHDRPYERPDSAVAEGEAFMAIPLPPLKGTEKQVIWAEDIRYSTWKIAFSLGVTTDEWRNLLNGKGLSAKWWIDNRPQQPDFNQMRTALSKLTT